MNRLRTSPRTTAALSLALLASTLVFGGAARSLAASVSATRTLRTAPIAFERTPHAPLVKAGAPHAAAPSLFFTASGHLYLLAAIENGEAASLGVFQSTDGGDRFERPMPVAGAAGVMTHGEMAPRFARDPEQRSMYVLWQDSGKNNDALHVAHAEMFGRGFASPSPVTDATVPFRAGFATLAAAPNGDVYSAWLDSRSGPTKDQTTDIDIARSTDGGATFGANVKVAAGVCPCCRPAFAFGDDGTAYLAWREVFPGNVRNIVVAHSSDGVAWSAPTVVSDDTWSIVGCPDSGPTMTVVGDTLHIAWFTLGAQGHAQLRAATSSDHARSFGPATVISGNVEDANHPSFATGPAPYPIVVFEGRDPSGGGFGKIHAFVVARGPKGWSAPTAIPSDARGMTTPVAVMRDPTTLYVAGTGFDDAGPVVELVRGRIAGGAAR